MLTRLSSRIQSGIETITLQGQVNPQIAQLLLNLTSFDEITEYTNEKVELIRYEPHVFPQQYLNRVSYELSRYGVEVLG